MTDKDKIRAEIERRRDKFRKSIDSVDRIKVNVYNGLLSFIDSLPEEPVSDSLNEAITAKFNSLVEKHGDFEKTYIDGMARAVAIACGVAGANWQKQQDEM